MSFDDKSYMMTLNVSILSFMVSTLCLQKPSPKPEDKDFFLYYKDLVYLSHLNTVSVLNFYILF